jgi:transposase
VLSHHDKDHEEKTITYNRPKNKQRLSLPENLLRKDVITYLKERDKFCFLDGATLKKVRENVSEKLEMIFSKVFVERTIRYKHVCPCCDEGIKTAPEPTPLLPNRMSSASLISYIFIAIFLDARSPYG